MWHSCLKLFSILIFFITVSSAAGAYQSDAIADDSEINHYAAIIYRNKTLTYQKCGGAIIHQNYVLTVAECVSDVDLVNLLVSVGGEKSRDEKRHPDLEMRSLKEVVKISYPLSYADYSNNLALVKIIGAFELDDVDHLGVVHMPFLNFTYKEKHATLFGYWRDGEFDRVGLIDDSVNFASIVTTIITNEECQGRLKGDLTADQLCTEPFVEKKCYGYPGDPLVYNSQIIGMLTGTVCDCNEPAVFTRVSEHVPFILDSIYYYIQ